MTHYNAGFVKIHKSYGRNVCSKKRSLGFSLFEPFAKRRKCEIFINHKQ